LGQPSVCVFDSEGGPITTLIGDAQVLSKWVKQSIDANPDMEKARRRERASSLNGGSASDCGRFRSGQRFVIIADSQRNRLQVYKKVRNYSDFQANL